MERVFSFFKKLSVKVDFVIFSAVIPIIFFSLMTMNSFASGDNSFFNRQIFFAILSVSVMFLFCFVDFRFLRRTDVLVYMFFSLVFVLAALFILGHISKGAQSWFRIGGFSFEPSDPAKLMVILILSKYFSRRHIEIANIKHILISAVYAIIPFVLVLLQPDFGSAIIIGFIWLGMVVLSGISKKHLLLVFLTGFLSFSFLWFNVFKDYQKARIINFVHPLTDIHGSGYNANQSAIAVGSGQVFGKGVGYGTQSRLQFLPEYETDFIFASFAEEWGFLGVLILFSLFGVLLFRILYNAYLGVTNFEILYSMGVGLYFMIHLFINVGMNIGLLPITGIPMPLMSYGGSHLLTECVALGILMGMKKYQRVTHRDNVYNEFIHVKEVV